jgi:hypothetical protein
MFSIEDSFLDYGRKAPCPGNSTPSSSKAHVAELGQYSCGQCPCIAVLLRELRFGYLSTLCGHLLVIASGQKTSDLFSSRSQRHLPCRNDHPSAENVSNIARQTNLVYISISTTTNLSNIAQVRLAASYPLPTAHFGIDFQPEANDHKSVY